MEDFFEAVNEGNVLKIQKMIDEGFDIRIKDQHGQNALHKVCTKFPVEISISYPQPSRRHILSYLVTPSPPPNDT